MTTSSWGGYRENSGRKAGFVSEKRKTPYATKVARVPKHWDVIDIQNGLAAMHSIIKENELEDLRAVFPKSFFPREKA